MARNEEKANAMLNRFLEAKKLEEKGPKQKRPYLATMCRDLNEADKWRQQILREIGRKVSEIQNPGLGEHRLRDLNDEINKLIREKGHWEERIVELGGQNYSQTSAPVGGDKGDEGPASGKGPGYRYFGAAKNLPGVRELFEKPPAARKRRTRWELYKKIDADYYGFRDDEDGVLVKLEAVAEKKMRAGVQEEWERKQREAEEALKASGAKVVVRLGADEALKAAETEAFLADIEREAIAVSEAAAGVANGDRRSGGAGPAAGGGGGGGGGGQFVAHVPLPKREDIEQLVMDKKKKELLSKYASEDLIAQEMEAKEMLNKRR